MRQAGTGFLRHRCEPELCERYYRRMVPWFFVCLFAGTSYPVLSGPVEPIIVWFGSGFFGLFVVGVMSFLQTLILPGIWVTLIVLWEKKLMARVRDSSYRLCPHCGYPMPMAAGQSTCPECGTSCNMRDVESSWRRFRPRFTARFAKHR